MKLTRFFLIVTLLIGVGLGTLLRQRTMLEKARSISSNRSVAAPDPGPRLAVETAPRETTPSSELLRLRGEVARLHRELDAHAGPVLSPQQMADDWALVHSGPKPSDRTDFVSFAGSSNMGFATPVAAFQSFNFVMRHQQQVRMDDTLMKTLWDVPDDFDNPDAKYSIDIGEGMGNEMGYRIVSQESIGTNQVRLTVDYERPDGTSFRRGKVLVEHNGSWRMKPAGLSRLPDAN
jgi:hypothetical protein